MLKCGHASILPYEIIQRSSEHVDILQRVRILEMGSSVNERATKSDKERKKKRKRERETERERERDRER
jgi:hypothetical protein